MRKRTVQRVGDGMAKKNQEPCGGRYYILCKIIRKYENRTTKSDWRQEKTGNKSIRIQQEDYDAFGKTELITEIRELERQGLIRAKYFSGGSDVEKVSYHLKDMDRFYEIEGKQSEKSRLQEASNCVSEYSRGAESPWLQTYYQEMLRDIDEGKYPEDVKKYGGKLFLCLNMVEKLREPVYIRVFSSRYLGGSKVFEDTLKSRVVSIGRKYHPMIDKAMKDQQVLSQLYLETYAQELELKGELKILLAGREADLSLFPYGLVLNTETLKNAEIPRQQEIRKIVTVENKANYMSMPSEKGTLILFCHGFFSPRELEFLTKLEQVLEEQRRAGAEIRYYHTGDLDYGGVRIFRYIRTNLFPKLRPWQMDAQQYERYREYAVDMETSSWEGLKEMEEPLLQPLIEKIVAEKKVIEQECFLFRDIEEQRDKEV